MGHTFTGTHRHKVDGKGRVSIPASFRSVLQSADPEWTDGLNPSVFLNYGPASQQHLECYTVEAMNEVNAKIARLRRGSTMRKMAERRYNGMTLQTTVDETGRLVLPAWLREKLGISDSAVFAARGDVFEIWSPERYEDVEAELESELEDLDGDLLELVELEIEKLEE